MKKIKRCFTIFLAVFWLSNYIAVGVAQANSLTPYLYPAVEMGEAGLAGAGFTLGGGLVIVGAVVAAAFQVKLIIDNWGIAEDMAASFGDGVKDWVNRLFNDPLGIKKFKNKTNGKTLEQALDDGDTINVWNYYATDKNMRVNISKTDLNSNSRYMGSLKGLEDLKGGGYTLQGRIQKIISSLDRTNDANYGPIAFSTPDILTYDSIVIKYNSYASFINFYCWTRSDDTKGLVSYLKNGSLYLNTDTSKTIDIFRLSVRREHDTGSYGYGVMTKYGNTTLKGENSDTYIGSYDNYNSLKLYSPDLKMIKGIIPLHVDAVNLREFNTDVRLDTSKYTMTGIIDDTITIDINDYLVDELVKVGGFDNVKDTDRVMDIVSKADAKARDNYKQVLNVAPVTTKAPLDIPILSDIIGLLDNIWQWLQDLWQSFVDALKGVVEWAFVPSDGKVQSFVDAAEQIVNSKSNILTYPIELVVIFLSRVMSLTKKDCVMTIPEISFKGRVLYKGTTFNFTQHVARSEYSSLYNYYILFTNAIMIIWVCNLAIKKGDEVIRGN